MTNIQSSPSANRSPSAECEAADPQVIAALEEYLRLGEDGAAPDPETFVARYPEIRDTLSGALAGLRFMQAAAPQVEASSEGIGAFLNLPLPLGEGGVRGARDDRNDSTLGDFRIIHEIGRGGMGIVYEAQQLSLNRRVALKVLPFAGMLDARQLQRFKNEAHAAAMLEHPHIVNVFFVGCERGVHFYAMRYVDGQSLAEAMADARRPAAVAHSSVSPDHDTRPVAAFTTQYTADRRGYFRSVAQLGIQAAQALEYAHQMAVVHRDIKPSNLLLDSQGQLWVTDFGLATAQGNANLTMTGDVVGTLRYMSPEQAAGKSAILDHRTDIYSLGMTLYELLTLQPAFPEQDRQTLLHRILCDEPVPPRTLNASIPIDLQTIVVKAIAKSPGDRYASAQALADDLQRFVEQRPIQARRLGRIARAWRWCKRSPAFAGVVTAAFGLLLCVAALAVLFALRETTHRQQAEAATEEAHWQQYVSDMHTAMAAWGESNVGRVMQLLDRHRPERGVIDHRGFEWYYLWNQCQPGLKAPTIDFDANVTALDVSRDGRYLVTATGIGTARITIWDAAKRLPLRNIIQEGSHILRILFSPDGALLAAPDHGSRGVHLWDVATGRSIRVLPSPRFNVEDLAFSPEGQRLVVTGDGHTPVIWDVMSGHELARLGTQESRVAFVDWLDADTVLTAHAEGVVRSWDARTGELQRVLSSLPTAIRRSALSPDRTTLVVSGVDHSIRMIDLREGRLIDAIVGHQGRIQQLAFSRDGQSLLSGGDDRRVVLWDVATRLPRQTFRGHSSSVTGVAFLDGDSRIVSGSQDRTVKFWNLGDHSANRATCLGHTWYVLDVAIDHTGRVLATASADGTVRLWDVPTAESLHVLSGHDNWVQCVACSPRDSVVASRGNDCTLRLWDLITGTLLWTASGLTGEVGNITFAADGRCLYSAEFDHGVRVWDVKTGVELRTITFTDQSIQVVASSPQSDVPLLAVATESGDIRLIDPIGERVIHTISGTGSPASSLAFSANGRRLAAGFPHDGSGRVWDTTTWDPLHTISHGEQVFDVALSPDGQILATAGMDNEVRLWDVATGQERGALRGHRLWTTGVAFSPDGSVLASSSDDRTVRLWRAASANVK